MSTIDLTTTIHDLKELKQMQDELAAEITALEDRIKQHMTENELDIINTANCLVNSTGIAIFRIPIFRNARQSS